MNKPPIKRRRTVLSADPVAEAILEWWKETEGPHNIPIMVGFGNSKKLADHLRSMGFIKDGIVEKPDEAEG